MNNRTLAALALPIAAALGLATVLGAAASDVNKAPTSYLGGPQTGLFGPKAVTVDAVGLRYVVSGEDSIAVFAPTASGNTAPIRTIAGKATQMRHVDGIAVDADGYVYVSDSFGTAQILVFAPGASGDVAPARVIAGPATQLMWPRGLAIDDVGRLYAANSDSNAVTVYAPEATGNATPLRTISGSETGLDYPVGIALTADNEVNVSNDLGDSITTYQAGASGNVAPIRTITGSATGLSEPWDLAADRQGNLYSLNWVGTHVVSVFSPGADGDVAPTARLAGSETDLGVDGRTGIEVDADGRVLVTIAPTSMLLTYAPLLTPPSVVRSLKVTGPSSAAKRTVTWKPPASVGGGAVTGYLVKVTAKGKTLLSKKLGAGTLKLVLKKAQLKVGKNVVTVQARNTYGLSPKRSVAVKVAK